MKTIDPPHLFNDVGRFFSLLKPNMTYSSSQYSDHSKFLFGIVFENLYLSPMGTLWIPGSCYINIITINNIVIINIIKIIIMKIIIMKIIIMKIITIVISTTTLRLMIVVASIRVAMLLRPPTLHGCPWSEVRLQRRRGRKGRGGLKNLGCC